jgi:hypothetical protein
MSSCGSTAKARCRTHRSSRDQDGRDASPSRDSGQTAQVEAVKLTPPIRTTLERALSRIQDDELVEVTPKTIRLRKLYLDPNERKRFEKQKVAAGEA